MQITFETLHLKKRFPLAISRGVRRDSYNVFVKLESDGIIGIGEVSPGKNEKASTPEEVINEISKLNIDQLSQQSIYELYELGRQMDIAPCAYAGLDIALWDLKAKKASMPLYKMLGLAKPTVATSVTIGINTPEVVIERVPLLLDGTGVKALKIKLGSPEGVDADKAMYTQVIESCKNYDVKIRVDANGGWSPEQAIHMMKWIADREAEYVEQPIAEGLESELPALFNNRPLPIFLDESCRFSQNIPKWAEYVDGVNLKLMKCGGITEALRILATAKAFGLKTMIGCMSESSISIAAGASISGIIDYIDLDSHYNLKPDPAEGAFLSNGITMITDKPGHGAQLKTQ